MVRNAEQLREDVQNAFQKVRLLDAAETVEFLDGKFSKWTLYELVKKGKIPHLKISGRVYFRPEALVDWLAELEQASVAAKQEPAATGIRRLK